MKGILLAIGATALVLGVVAYADNSRPSVTEQPKPATNWWEVPDPVNKKTNYSHVTMKTVEKHLNKSMAMCKQGADDACSDAEVYGLVYDEMVENGGTIDKSVIDFYQSLKFD